MQKTEIGAQINQMEGSLLLGVRLVPNQYQCIKIENINLECKVDSLKEKAAKEIKAEKHCIGVYID